MSVLLALLVLASPLRPAPPTRAALGRAARAARGALVEVVGPHQSGTGVVVGRDGEVLTSVRLVGLESAQVRLRGRLVSTRVLVANARLGVAVLQLPEGDYAAAPVRLLTQAQAGGWLIGLSRRGGALPVPSPARILSSQAPARPFLTVSGPLPLGSPLFDERGELVAVVIARAARSATAILLPPVEAELGRAGVR